MFLTLGPLGTASSVTSAPLSALAGKRTNVITRASARRISNGDHHILIQFLARIVLVLQATHHHVNDSDSIHVPD